MCRHTSFIFLVLLSFFPLICHSQEAEEEGKNNDLSLPTENTETGKNKNLSFPSSKAIDSVNTKNKKTCDDGNDVVKYYCNQDMKLYKPRLSLSLENHKLKWNFREDSITYSYGRIDVLEYKMNDDAVIYKHKFFFDF